MIFRQITHDDLGCASYLIGDDHAAVAAVVDTRRLGAQEVAHVVGGGVPTWRRSGWPVD